MSIAIIFNNKDPEPWKRELEKNLPNTLIEVYPDIKDKQKVEFILCWKPAPGVTAEFPNVKVIQSVGASAEHIFNTQTLKEGIVITRIVDENLSVDMFEFILSIILFKLKNLHHYVTDQMHQIWKPAAYRSIENTEVTILGLGQIGSYVASRLVQMNFSVKGWSNSKKEIGGVKSFYGQAQYLEALKNSDFLVNLLPLTAATTNIIDYSALSQLGKGATIINVGRGEHLIEDDLITLLDSNHLSGAILDVFRQEPLPQDHQFWHHPNILITPHIASLTNINSAALLVAGNYRRLLNSEQLLHTVSPNKGY